MQVKPFAHSPQILDKTAPFAMVFEAAFPLMKDSIYENHDFPPLGPLFRIESLPS